MSELYRCGIIEESSENIKVLEKIRKHFVKSRVQSVPDRKPSVWHVYEYNIHDDVLYIVLKEKVSDYRRIRILVGTR